MEAAFTETTDYGESLEKWKNPRQIKNNRKTKTNLTSKKNNPQTNQPTKIIPKPMTTKKRFYCEVLILYSDWGIGKLN